jgi:hypothetical protein
MGTSGTTGISPVTDGKSLIPASIPRLVWSGDVPHQKWMNFYTKVLSKFAASAGLKLTLRVEVAPPEGVSPQKVDETKVALRELGLKDSLEGECVPSSDGLELDGALELPIDLSPHRHDLSDASLNPNRPTAPDAVTRSGHLARPARPARRGYTE